MQRSRFIGIERGGSSSQACLIIAGTPALLVDATEAPRIEVQDGAYGLATPGVLRAGRLYYASNLRIPDGTPLADVAGAPIPLAVATNDAVAAAAGEWYLRRDRRDVNDLSYVGLGTGVGSARVRDGHMVENVALGHTGRWTGDICPGCGATGCLDTAISGRVLPSRLSDEDVQFIVRVLGRALHEQVPDGVARRHPAIVKGLRHMLDTAIESSKVPAEFKSSAPFGLWALYTEALVAR